MKLIVGSFGIDNAIYGNVEACTSVTLLDPPLGGPPQVLEDEGKLVCKVPISELMEPGLGRLGKYRERITQVFMAYGPYPDLNFLRHLPNVWRVWLMTSTVEDFSGLLYLSKLRTLDLSTLKKRLDILGELTSLEELSLLEWRPGAEALFRLHNLRHLWLWKYPGSDLSAFSNLKKLELLRLVFGRVETLTGIPPSIRDLSLEMLRKLHSLQALAECSRLEKLVVEGCRQVQSLSGLEGCEQLRHLGMRKTGLIESLDPLSSCQHLEFVGIAEGAIVADRRVEALYSLPHLKHLIISKRSGLDVDYFRTLHPHCKLHLAT